MTWYSAAAATLLGAALFNRLEVVLATLTTGQTYDLVMNLMAFAFNLVGMAWAFWFCERNMVKFQSSPSAPTPTTIAEAPKIEPAPTSQAVPTPKPAKLPNSEFMPEDLGG
jgi:hypothetical protein